MTSLFVFHNIPREYMHPPMISNDNGLESQFENLHEFLSRLQVDFNIIKITETSQKIDGLKSNTSIPRYESYTRCHWYIR